MLKTGKLTALILLGALTSAACAEDKTAVKVNDVAIPQARVDFRVKTAVATQGQTDTPELRKMIREDLINLEVLAQEAGRLGLDKEPDIAQQIDIARESVLASALVQDMVKNKPISDEQLHQEYDRLKTSLGGKEYNARHILVGSEAEAKAIIAQLGKKGKFEKLAAEKSKDTGSANQGGSLGWNVPSSFVQPFAQALSNLKKGEYTKEPVQSEFGWHIIKLDDVRDMKMPSFDELKPQISQRLQQQTIQEAVAALRAKAKID
jgi:peptidyl-prolyl cis-trans isomerase C